MLTRAVPVLLLVLAVLVTACDTDDTDEPAPEEGEQNEVTQDDEGDDANGGEEGADTGPAELPEIEQQLRADFFLPDDAQVRDTSFLVRGDGDGYQINATFTTGLSREELVAVYEEFFDAEGWTTSDRGDDDGERASTTLDFERDDASGQMVIREREDGAQVALLFDKLPS